MTGQAPLRPGHGPAPAARPEPLPAIAGYRERLRCPLSWYLIGAVSALVLGAEVLIVAPHLPGWLVYPLSVAGSAIIVAWIGRARVTVQQGTLHVKGARLEPSYVAGVVALDTPTMRRLIGRDGDPAAFHATKPWLGPGVQILLDDPDDPTPYWVVSSRHPRKLAAALTAGSRPSTPGAQHTHRP